MISGEAEAPKRNPEKLSIFSYLQTQWGIFLWMQQSEGLSLSHNKGVTRM